MANGRKLNKGETKMALFTIVVTLLLVFVLIGTAGITVYMHKQIEDRDKALELLTKVFMSGDDDNERHN